MTTPGVTGGFRMQPVWQELVSAPAAGWQNFRRRREQRRAIVAMSPQSQQRTEEGTRQ